MTDVSTLDEAGYRLRKLLATQGADLASTQPWFWEADRWKELAFALLARISEVPQADLRRLVDHLSDLDLLDIDTLATLEPSGIVARRISDLMREAGMNDDEATTARATLTEAAEGLRRSHQGKVQRYLRKYGELMLRELQATFHFSMMKPDEVEDAFTFWFQNAIEMPLSLVDDSVKAFCERAGFTPADLIEAADEIDMNLALVDDLVQLDMLASPAEWLEDTAEGQDAG